ncbi:uncharacterized protein LOC130991640 [Salvia miltiorrhiza]|uniref:uncharacterized protein LOC130991640 n=1 Tax=Salvia miltiorrhiza TaxID=226208 RepID=UPI0025AC88DA|nr:uncharacterized protein LOC130991640 [Salvia miltiorrhiza]
MSQLCISIEDDGVPKFYSTMLPVVFNITFTRKIGHDSDDDRFSCTGFCISSTGLLMTCAHCVPSENVTCSIIGRRRDGSWTHDMTAKIVKIFKKWDVCILQLVSKENVSFDFVTFANENDQICVGEDVHYIGGLAGLYFAYVKGMISCPCGYDLESITNIWKDRKPEDFTLMIKSYENYSLPPEMYGLGPPYTIRAGIAGYYHMHPLTPLIETNTMSYAGVASGSPLFNSRGQVIGMVIGGGRGTMATHHVILKFFMDKVIEEEDGGGKGKEEDGGEEEEEGGGGTSQSMKGKKKKKKKKDGRKGKRGGISTNLFRRLMS